VVEVAADFRLGFGPYLVRRLKSATILTSPRRSLAAYGRHRGSVDTAAWIGDPDRAMSDKRQPQIDPPGASQNLGSVTCENCGAAVLLQANGRPRVHAFCEEPECRRAAARARQRAHRAGTRSRPIDPPMPDHVRTVHGNNSELISAVARLYVPDGAVVADVT
jgi:hypothetical protein